MKKNSILLIAGATMLTIVLGALTTVFTFANKVRWEDSVRIYRERAQWGDEEAYQKLAVCYHKGLGVEHGFLQTMWLLGFARVDGSENKVSKFFMDLPDDDSDKLMFLLVLAFRDHRNDKIREIGRRLALVDPLGKELTDGLLAENDEKKIRHFRKAADKGHEMAQYVLYVMLADNSKNDRIYWLEELAKKSPVINNVIGQRMEEYMSLNQLGDSAELLAYEYYMRADENGCLNKDGARFLLRFYDKDDNQYLADSLTLKRLRILSGENELNNEILSGTE